jgi:hypothetical protein
MGVAWSQTFSRCRRDSQQDAGGDQGAYARKCSHRCYELTGVPDSMDPSCDFSSLDSDFWYTDDGVVKQTVSLEISPLLQP